MRMCMRLCMRISMRYLRLLELQVLCLERVLQLRDGPRMLRLE